MDEGVAYATQTKTAFIKEKMESYIIEKVASLGANVDVEVSLSEEDIPTDVKFTGYIPPYLKGQLEEYLKINFTIPKECITWS